MGKGGWPTVGVAASAAGETAAIPKGQLSIVPEAKS